MKRIMTKLRDLILLYLKWGWPLVLADAGLRMRLGEPASAWRSFINTAAFAWVLCLPLVPLRLLIDRGLRERVMARVCGLREGDERERAVTGEAARATLLLGLSLQVVMLVLCMVSVHLSYDPGMPEGHRGLLEVGMGFSSSLHLDPTGTLPPSKPESGAPLDVGGFVLTPAAFPILALLILLQLAAFKAFAMRRYEGTEA